MHLFLSVTHTENTGDFKQEKSKNTVLFSQGTALNYKCYLFRGNFTACRRQEIILKEGLKKDRE